MKYFSLSFLLGLTLPAIIFAAGAGGGGGGGVEGLVGTSVGSTPPTEQCAKSTWACSEWSACSAEGKRERICTKKFDCPSDTVTPVEEEACTLPKKALPPVNTHWCYTLPFLKQRVECRLGLSEKDLEAEYKKQYLPEECRAVRVQKLQTACVARYKALQPCWGNPVGEERIACAKEALDIPSDLKAERTICVSLAKKTLASRRASAACLTALRQKTYHLVKFRFYDLNERVEDFLEEHNTIDGRAGIQFIVTSELHKQRFNNAR